MARSKKKPPAPMTLGNRVTAKLAKEFHLSELVAQQLVEYVKFMLPGAKELWNKEGLEPDDWQTMLQALQNKRPDVPELVALQDKDGKWLQP